MEDKIAEVGRVTTEIIKLVWGFDVSPEVSIDGMGINVELRSRDRSVISQLVGRGGANVAAIRRLMAIWGSRNRARVNVYAMPAGEEIIAE